MIRFCLSDIESRVEMPENSSNSDATYRELIQAFTNFLTVAIHTILYERGIYPQSSFLSARKYEFAVRQNRHPKVCEWINDAVDAAEAELLKCTVDRLAVVIHEKQNTPLERFVFDVSRFPIVPASEIDVTMQRMTADSTKLPILPMVDLEEQLRATMSRLSNCGSMLEPLPTGCAFTLAIELRDEASRPIGHPQPWIPAQPDPDQDITRNDQAQHTTTPIRSVRAGEMVFETWIDKLKSASTSSQGFASTGMS
jgi:mitotic spindle assembly checkpoint protein MAD2B